MPDTPSALLALWNDVDPALDARYRDWHAREHVPERLTVPGIDWALRYGRLDDADSPMPHYLTLYGLRDAAVLDSEAYRRLLAHPTPTSRAMRPALRRVTRWVCALEHCDALEACDRLRVRTVAREAPRPRPPARGGLLIATHCPEAAALPWLAGGQPAQLDGDRLEGWAYAHPADAEHAAPGPAEVDAAWAGAVVYGRLPIG